MIEVISIIAYFLCVIIATFGAIAVAGNLKAIKDNQEYIMFCIDRIEEHLSDGEDGEE